MTVTCDVTHHDMKCDEGKRITMSHHWNPLIRELAMTIKGASHQAMIHRYSPRSPSIWQDGLLNLGSQVLESFWT